MTNCTREPRIFMLDPLFSEDCDVIGTLDISITAMEFFGNCIIPNLPIIKFRRVVECRRPLTDQRVDRVVAAMRGNLIVQPPGIQLTGLPFGSILHPRIHPPLIHHPPPTLHLLIHHPFCSQ